jgi:hypothetical protein
VNKMNRSQDGFICFILFLIFLIAGYSQIVGGVCGIYHDDGVYVITAKALAEGEGYRLINLPDAPYQTKYPFLYPLILSMIWVLVPSFPQNILIMQCVNLLFGALAIALCYRYLIRFQYFSRPVIFLALLLCSTSPYFLFYTANILSEMPFFFLIVLMLWVFDHTCNVSSTNRWQEFGLGILIALPFLCRAIGLIFIPIALFVWYFKRKTLRWIVLGCTLSVVPWMLWVLNAGEAGKGPAYLYYTDYVGWWAKYGISNIGYLLVSNFFSISVSILSIGMYGALKFIAPENILLMIVIILLGTSFWISIILHKKQNGSLRYFLSGYLLLTCIWPWPPSRFLVPLSPFILCYLLCNVESVLKTVKLFNWLKIFSLILIILISSNLYSVFQQSKINHMTNYPQLGNNRTPNITWSSYEKVFLWLRENSRPTDVIASGLDTMIYLYTGLIAIRPFEHDPLSLFYGKEGPKIGTTKDLERIFQYYNPRYLVLTPMPAFYEEEHFKILIELYSHENPGRLSPVYIGDDPRYLIYEVRYDSAHF